MEFVNAVKAYALANYNKDGWDYVVECWGDKEIAEEIQGCKTEKEAISRMRKIVKMQDEYRSDIESTAF